MDVFREHPPRLRLRAFRRYGGSALAAGDAIAGVCVIVLGVLALRERWDFIGRWGDRLIGTGLLFAPLVFWAPTSAAGDGARRR